MGGPRHLWSGDWRHESSAHAEDLAARRTERREPAEPAPAVPAPRRPPDPRAAVAQPPAPRSRIERPPVPRRATRTLLSRLRSLGPGGRRRLRAAGLILSLTLLSAGGAYVVTSLVVRVMGGA